MKQGWNFRLAGVLAMTLLWTAGCGSKGDGDPATGKENSGGDGAKSATKANASDAQGVLDAMVAAYNSATSYTDGGAVRLYFDMGDEPFDRTEDFSVTMVRPNKLRMHAYEAAVVCDGERLWSFIKILPGQLVSRPAPAKITPENISADPVMWQGLTGGFAGACPQFMLLTMDNPLADILEGADKPTLLEPEKIGENLCDRVEVKRPDGTAVFWIDQKTHVLRRMEYPVEQIAQQVSGGQEIRAISMIAEFPGATLGGTIDPQAFAFEAPADVKPERMFTPRNLTELLGMPDPRQLLSKPVPAFTFTDLDGKPVTPDSLGGKVALLDFWGMDCQYCMEDLPELEKLYEKYKDKVVFLAVNVDAPEITDKQLEERFETRKVTIPIVRDTNSQAVSLLLNGGRIPAIYLVGAKGRLRDIEFGRRVDLVSEYSEKLDKLLAGEDLSKQQAEAYQEELDQYKANVEMALEGKLPDVKGGSAGGPMAQEVEIPRVDIAPHADPKHLKLTSLWKFTDVGMPGNVTVVPGAGGAPRILVVDTKQVNHVLELGADGKLVTNHALAVQPPELVLDLTTAADGDGKRYFVGTAVGQQRVHLFDDQFKLLLSYPDDALENRHPGIWTGVPADLDGDGKLELYVGYWGTVGLQAATLEGKRIWGYRRISGVNRLAVGGADAQGRHILWCTHERATLAGVSAAGEPSGEVALRNRPLRSAFAADLTGDGQPEWCGRSELRLGTPVAVGFDLHGKELWNYELPRGVPERPIEPVIAGQVKPEGPGQWIFPAADGSIHILAPDGTLVDRFNYGAVLCGLATVKIDGKPALVVATPDGVEAWAVQ